MARPRLGEEERRRRTIGVRVTEAEEAELRERAQAARLSMGAYLRRRALDQRVRSAVERRLGAAELRELNRIGVNLNQMARALNSGAVSSPAETQEAVERVGELVAKLLAGGEGVMVVKMSSPGRSFGGVAEYCLHDPRMPGQGHPESAKRVEWTETRNLATEQGDRAARIMAATAEASPELKRLAGAAATGRKLEKPVCHYSLNWAREEKPDRQEMQRAAEASLKALGMERHQALIVSHRDGQPHVHVIANRVEPESGKAAGLSRSKLKLSKWAEGYEREQGKIRCPQRERNNKRREAGERVVDGRGHSGGRFRRERMSPQREPREVIPAEREGPERERVAWQRAEERMHWERIQQWRRQDLGKLERRSKWEWSELYGRQERQRQQLAKDCHGVLGRFRAWRELGGKLREIGGTIRGRTEVLGRFRAELETRQRLERISLGKAHSEAVRKIESLAGEVYRGDMEGAEGRAREATRRDPLAVYDRYRGGDRDRLKRSASEERMEQVREFDGEQAYEKMMREMEKARQEKARQAEMARQVERARLEWDRQETARQSRERRGPERDFGPSR